MVADPKLLAKLAATGLDALSTDEGVGMILRSIHSTEKELIIAKLRVAPEKLEEALSADVCYREPESQKNLARTIAPARSWPASIDECTIEWNAKDIGYRRDV